MPGTKKENLYYETGVRPIEIEIAMRQAVYFERVSRQGGSQQLRALRPPPAQTPTGTCLYRQVPMNACRLMSETILRSSGLDPSKISRSPLIRVSTIPPWARDHHVNVRFFSEVSPGTKKNSLTKGEQLKLVNEVIERHLAVATAQGFTDGSAHIKLGISGAAGTIYMKNELGWYRARIFKTAGGKHSCSFTVEAIALRDILQLLLDEQGQIIVIFIDCKSLLDALEAGSIDQKEHELEVI